MPTGQKASPNAYEHEKLYLHQPVYAEMPIGKVACRHCQCWGCEILAFGHQNDRNTASWLATLCQAKSLTMAVRFLLVYLRLFDWLPA